MTRYRVFWGNADLGWVDSYRQAEGVIRERDTTRRKAYKDRGAFWREYRVVPETEGGS